MALLPGTRLDRYEVRSILGSGAMGEVYLRRDLRLQREVAIKVLPDHLACDPQRRAPRTRSPPRLEPQPFEHRLDLRRRR